MRIRDVVYFVIFGLLILWGLNNIFIIYQTNHTPKFFFRTAEDKNYAQNIKMQIYLMTPEQVGLLFKDNPDGVPEYWIYQEERMSKIYSVYATYHKPLFLVVRLKNEGPLLTWGTLRYHLYHRPENTLQVLPLPPKMDHFVNYVVNGYLSGAVFKQLGAPEIPNSWEFLYVQK